MIYGVMVRDAEGEGTEFFVCVAKNFEEAYDHDADKGIVIYIRELL